MLRLALQAGLQINNYKMKSKIIKVGIDFDGVLAYNPFRLARAPVTFFKRHFLGVKKTQFYIPKSEPEKFIWTILHESSVLPGKGAGLLRSLVKEGNIEAHLVTARFGFLQPGLDSWLRRWNLTKTFKTITMNHADEQPHLYKTRVVGEKKLDFFIEDNFDIVSHIAPRSPTRVMWIYNIIDRGKPYEWKYPYLEKALQEIMLSTKIQNTNSK